MAILTGGCQCGAVRYRFEGEPGSAGICHCRMCQKAGGNFGMALIKLAADHLTWTKDPPAEFRSSAIVARGFCAKCGTPLHMREDGDAHYEIAIGSLDDPNAIGPMDNQDGIESETKWFATLHTLPRRTTAQTRNPAALARLATRQHPDRD